jgi:hypothetical protein
MRRNGTLAALPMDKKERFESYRVRDISIARGDRIRVTKNGEVKVEGQKKGTRINNDDIFTIEGFAKEGDIRLEKGKILPKDWGHMSLGYVDTSYAGQGKTVVASSLRRAANPSRRRISSNGTSMCPVAAKWRRYTSIQKPTCARRLPERASAFRRWN